MSNLPIFPIPEFRKIKTRRILPTKPARDFNPSIILVPFVSVPALYHVRFRACTPKCLPSPRRFLHAGVSARSRVRSPCPLIYLPISHFSFCKFEILILLHMLYQSTVVQNSFHHGWNGGEGEGFPFGVVHDLPFSQEEFQFIPFFNPVSIADDRGKAI